MAEDQFTFILRISLICYGLDPTMMKSQRGSSANDRSETSEADGHPVATCFTLFIDSFYSIGNSGIARLRIVYALVP
jgi:hypothetical protein